MLECQCEEYFRSAIFSLDTRDLNTMAFSPDRKLELAFAVAAVYWQLPSRCD
jgi:hypothetical protein